MTTTSIEELVERTMRDIELRGAGPLVFGYQQVENGVRYALTAQAKEIERLREGLEPFAKAADVKLCGEWKDDEHFGRTDVQLYLTFGDLRRARALLTKEPTP